MPWPSTSGLPAHGSTRIANERSIDRIVITLEHDLVITSLADQVIRLGALDWTDPAAAELKADFVQGKYLARPAPLFDIPQMNEEQKLSFLKGLLVLHLRYDWCGGSPCPLYRILDNGRPNPWRNPEVLFNDRVVNAVAFWLVNEQLNERDEQSVLEDAQGWLAEKSPESCYGSLLVCGGLRKPANRCYGGCIDSLFVLAETKARTDDIQRLENMLLEDPDFRLLEELRDIEAERSKRPFDSLCWHRNGRRNNWGRERHTQNLIESLSIKEQELTELRRRFYKHKRGARQNERQRMLAQAELMTPAQRLLLLLKYDQLPLGAFPEEWSTVDESELRGLGCDVVAFLIGRISNRRKGPWHELQVRMTRANRHNRSSD